MENSNLQWHPAFFAALQIDLEDEDVPLQFFSEFNLTQKPLQIDVLIVKKESDKPLKKKIGKLFRRHNIIEYKCEGDYLSINDFYKAIAYACFYQSNTKHVLEIHPDDITVTLVCSRFPRKLVKYIKKRYHATILTVCSGIYYILGLLFPIQIWLIGKLPPDEVLWVNSLRSDLNAETDLAALEHAYRGKKDIPNYATAMDVIVRANQKLMKGGQPMCQALREIFADEFIQYEEKGRLEGRLEGQFITTITQISKKLCKNKKPEEIAEELEESLEYISRLCNIAQKYAPEYDVELIYQEFITT